MSKLISTHWGTYEVHQNDQNDIILKSWEKDPSPTDFGLGLVDAAKDKLRINQPYVRKGWMQKKNQSDNNRGRDEFIPVDWETGLSLAAEALEITKNKHHKEIVANLSKKIYEVLINEEKIMSMKSEAVIRSKELIWEKTVESIYKKIEFYMDEKNK